MSATVSNVIPPAAERTPGMLARHLNACMDAIVRYFVRRGAIATLRELDDRTLWDIGLARSEIEAAVHGLVTPLDQERI
jgi:uncharacterized protein YjiS (DUF1127 family)